jgi:ArsR family transcriptional regulator, lead/cadmium/zinc/bismuth-responsive transcriptional repressor
LDLEKAETLREGRLESSRVGAAALQVKAMADPTRLTLAHALAQTDEACVCDLAWVMERAENLVSHHLKVLRHAGLVSSRRDGKMVLYSLTARGQALVELALAADVEAPGVRA